MTYINDQELINARTEWLSLTTLPGVHEFMTCNSGIKSISFVTIDQNYSVRGLALLLSKTILARPAPSLRNGESSTLSVVCSETVRHQTAQLLGNCWEQITLDSEEFDATRELYSNEVDDTLHLEQVLVPRESLDVMTKLTVTNRSAKEALLDHAEFFITPTLVTFYSPEKLTWVLLSKLQTTSQYSIGIDGKHTDRSPLSFWLDKFEQSLDGEVIWVIDHDSLQNFDRKLTEAISFWKHTSSRVKLTVVAPSSALTTVRYVLHRNQIRAAGDFTSFGQGCRELFTIANGDTFINSAKSLFTGIQYDTDDRTQPSVQAWKKKLKQPLPENEKIPHVPFTAEDYQSMLTISWEGNKNEYVDTWKIQHTSVLNIFHPHCDGFKLLSWHIDMIKLDPTASLTDLLRQIVTLENGRSCSSKPSLQTSRLLNHPHDWINNLPYPKSIPLLNFPLFLVFDQSDINIEALGHLSLQKRNLLLETLLSLRVISTPFLENLIDTFSFDLPCFFDFSTLGSLVEHLNQVKRAIDFFSNTLLDYNILEVSDWKHPYTSLRAKVNNQLCFLDLADSLISASTTLVSTPERSIDSSVVLITSKPLNVLELMLLDEIGLRVLPKRLTFDWYFGYEASNSTQQTPIYGVTWLWGLSIEMLTQILFIELISDESAKAELISILTTESDKKQLQNKLYTSLSTRLSKTSAYLSDLCVTSNPDPIAQFSESDLITSVCNCLASIDQKQIQISHDQSRKLIDLWFGQCITKCRSEFYNSPLPIYASGAVTFTIHDLLEFLLLSEQVKPKEVFKHLATEGVNISDLAKYKGTNLKYETSVKCLTISELTATQKPLRCIYLCQDDELTSLQTQRMLKAHPFVSDLLVLRVVDLYTNKELIRIPQQRVFIPEKYLFKPSKLRLEQLPAPITNQLGIELLRALEDNNSIAFLDLTRLKQISSAFGTKQSNELLLLCLRVIFKLIDIQQTALATGQHYQVLTSLLPDTNVEYSTAFQAFESILASKQFDLFLKTELTLIEMLLTEKTTTANVLASALSCIESLQKLKDQHKRVGKLEFWESSSFYGFTCAKQEVTNSFESSHWPEYSRQDSKVSRHWQPQVSLHDFTVVSEKKTLEPILIACENLHKVPVFKLVRDFFYWTLHKLDSSTEAFTIARSWSITKFDELAKDKSLHDIAELYIKSSMNKATLRNLSLCHDFFTTSRIEDFFGSHKLVKNHWLNERFEPDVLPRNILVQVASSIADAKFNHGKFLSPHRMACFKVTKAVKAVNKVKTDTSSRSDGRVEIACYLDRGRIKYCQAGDRYHRVTRAAFSAPLLKLASKDFFLLKHELKLTSLWKSTKLNHPTVESEVKRWERNFQEAFQKINPQLTFESVQAHSSEVERPICLSVSRWKQLPELTAQIGIGYMQKLSDLQEVATTKLLPDEAILNLNSLLVQQYGLEHAEFCKVKHDYFLRVQQGYKDFPGYDELIRRALQNKDQDEYELIGFDFDKNKPEMIQLPDRSISAEFKRAWKFLLPSTQRKLNNIGTTISSVFGAVAKHGESTLEDTTTSARTNAQNSKTDAHSEQLDIARILGKSTYKPLVLGKSDLIARNENAVVTKASVEGLSLSELDSVDLYLDVQTLADPSTVVSNSVLLSEYSKQKVDFLTPGYSYTAAISKVLKSEPNVYEFVDLTDLDCLQLTFAYLYSQTAFIMNIGYSNSNLMQPLEKSYYSPQSIQNTFWHDQEQPEKFKWNTAYLAIKQWKRTDSHLALDFTSIKAHEPDLHYSRFYSELEVNNLLSSCRLYSEWWNSMIHSIHGLHGILNRKLDWRFYIEPITFDLKAVYCRNYGLYKLNAFETELCSKLDNEYKCVVNGLIYHYMHQYFAKI